MKHSLYIFSLLTAAVLCNFNLHGQETEQDSIYFKVRLAAYVDIPDSVNTFITNEVVTIREHQTCEDDKQPVYLIEIGCFSCYDEAKKALERLILDGYEGAFIIGLKNDNEHIAVEEAKERTMPNCDYE